MNPYNLPPVSTVRPRKEMPINPQIPSACDSMGPVKEVSVSVCGDTS